MPIDEMEERIGSRYDLVMLAAKRAKQLQEGAPPLVRTESTNPLTIALEEIAAGRYPRPEGEPEGILPVSDAGEDEEEGEEALEPGEQSEDED
jgi:DNA-directed RNA polymerase subunit omega